MLSSAVKRNRIWLAARSVERPIFGTIRQSCSGASFQMHPPEGSGPHSIERDPFFSLAAGITEYGARTASEFPTESKYFEEALKDAPADWSRRNMELVIRAKVVAGNPAPPEVVASPPRLGYESRAEEERRRGKIPPAFAGIRSSDDCVLLTVSRNPLGWQLFSIRSSRSARNRR